MLSVCEKDIRLGGGSDDDDSCLEDDYSEDSDADSGAKN